MASISISIVDVAQAGGKVFVRWNDGVEQEFDSLQETKNFVRPLMEDKDWLRRLALSRYLFIDPTGSNPSLIEGKTITATNESNSMITVT